MARVELGALTTLRNIVDSVFVRHDSAIFKQAWMALAVPSVHQHQHLWRADEIDIACKRQFISGHADGSPKVVVQID